MSLSAADRTFLDRVALRLVALGIEEPTECEIEAAMRHTLERDEQLCIAFFNRARDEEQSMIATALTRAVWHKAREGA